MKFERLNTVGLRHGVPTLISIVECEEIARTLEEWASVMLADAKARTGWPLAYQWQSQFGPLPTEFRLIPKVPFVLGGDYAVSNLSSLYSVKAMNYYGDLAVQIRDLPNGSQIELRVVD